MRWLRFFLFIFLLFSAKAGLADHLVGGEFKVSSLGNFEYDIQLIVYGDNKTLTTGNQDQNVAVTIFEKGTNLTVESFALGLKGTAFVPYVNQNCQSGSIQTKILTYQVTRSLAPQLYNSPNGYYIVWERCCRNMGISNIVSPNQSGFVYYAEIPPVILNNQEFLNNSPVLPPMPPDVLCVGELYQYSMKSTDKDGDALVYKLSTPMRGTTAPGSPFTAFNPGPYSPVIWANGYGLNNQINGSPNLTIHPATGLIQVRPNLAGLFVFAITVEEYRNGVKIGEVRRDIQVKVIPCVVNQKPVISLRQPGAARDYQPGDTLLVTDATDYCYQLRFSDPDIGQTLTLKVEPINFASPPLLTPASGTIQQSGQVLSSRICWADCNVNSPNQLYKVRVIVTDNPCGQSSSDTLELSFLVIPKPNVRPQVITQNLAINEVTVLVGEPVNFKLLSSDADKDQITLKMSGNGFIPAAEGMTLSPLAGKEAFSSSFSWTPTCDQKSKRETYDLRFVVKDNSCFPNHSDTVLVRIRLRELENETIFLPPNIFTPNNDKRNDFFIAPTLPLDKCDDTFQEIRIFNRWGGLVYKSADRQFAWDGKNVSDGVYYYAIRFQKRSYRGYITIVR